MKDVSNMTYNTTATKLVDILCQKTQSTNRLFFHVLVAYYFAKLSSMMRARIKTHDRGKIPINLYAINLASCVDMNTEFLTPTGWKRMCDYTNGDSVLEIDPNNNFEGKFKKPLKYIAEHTTELAYRVSPTSGTKMSMMVSPNHGVFYGQINGSKKLTYHTKPAKEFFNLCTKNTKIYSNFNLIKQSTCSLSNDELRLMVAFCANGVIKEKHKFKACIRIKKQQKAYKLRALLNRLNITFKEVKNSEQTTFWFNPPILDKSFMWAWGCDAKQLAVITHESILWSGTVDTRTGNYCFFTTIKESADFMQYAYQSTFDTIIGCSIRDRRDKPHNTNNENCTTKSIDYIVRQTNSLAKSITSKNVSRSLMPNNMQYCFTTSTGYWLMRKDGHISVTQNSGEGKGYSTNIIEESVINIFRERFFEETFQIISNKNLEKLARKRSLKKNIDEFIELERVQKEFNLLGNFTFSFDSGTTAAVKQMRHKLLMADAGSMNMEIDEIGSNLLGNVNVLTTFLELFDVGKVKQKLTKNTVENVRGEEIEGKTPTNMLLFGTPAKLLDGGKIEDEFYNMLETGYARRCLFGYNKLSAKNTNLTPNEVYDMLTDNKADVYLQTLSTKLGVLADIVNFNTIINVDKKVSLLIIEYKLNCEKIANQLSDHEEIRKAEISHRYFKATKLAGAYAFIDGSSDLTEDHLYNAIKLVEDSGKAFESLLTRERNYVKLANYIATVNKEVTHVDMVEDLPFYKGSENQKREIMNLAIAYGYKNNIIIKKIITDGIEFLKGESLNETNLNKMIVSYGTKLAADYHCNFAPFKELHKLTQLPNHHWVSHHLVDGYRKEENILPGFNMVVLDVDNGITIETAKLLLQEYTYLIYTTKRHKLNAHRFRIILPLSHTLKMDSLEFKEFMSNIFEWIPFDVDKQTNQRSRKWMSHDGNHFYNDGELLNALLFIPKTSKNEERKKIINSQQSLSNLERWFISNTGIGNRSNQLIKYALMLVDSGMSLDSIQNNILALNSKLPDKMDEAEIISTILVTSSKAIHKRDIKT